ncbi:AraC family transcriptional regulator [Maribacter cobaltidurans]|uniref:AraC family transcriptional regulator n=2 Tax=Flavobacteriaceae TaxID=49546 RepID=A0ABU7IU70_9FLAO|nr:AraC family transcriptional regulator [Maribacter cobaltidurans]
MGGEAGKCAEFGIPMGIEFQCCYLILEPNKLASSDSISMTRLQSDLLDVFEPFLNKDKSFRFFGGISAKISEFATILIENERTDVVGRLLAEGALMNMLASQIEAHDREKNTDKIAPQVGKAELSRMTGLGDLVRGNIGNRPSIKELAKKVGVSRNKLQAGVKYLYGCTVNQFVNNIRLEVARELIHNTEMNQSEICYHIGFSSRSHFSKIFEERFGKVPSEYKKSFKRKKQVLEIPSRSMS